MLAKANSWKLAMNHSVTWIDIEQLSETSVC